MSRINFLNALSATDVTFNMGAGVPPIELYPPFNPSELYHSFESQFPKTPTLNYHNTAGIISNLGQETFQKNENLYVEENHIFSTNGVQEAIGIVSILFKNKTIACRDPYYPGLVDTVRMTGNEPMLLNADNWIYQTEILPAGSLVYLSADYANPTGERLSVPERKRLMTIAEDKDLYIFDDCTYREFFLDEKRPALSTYNPNRVFHALSFSKILAPGLRSALVSVPQKFIKEFGAIKANLSLNNSGITQSIVGAWLIQNEFHLNKHLSKAKQRLTENKLILSEHGVDYSGGFFARMTLETHEATLDWCHQLLVNEEVSVCPMTLFSDGNTKNKDLRLAVAKISKENLLVALSKIRNFDASNENN